MWYPILLIDRILLILTGIGIIIFAIWYYFFWNREEYKQLKSIHKKVREYRKEYRKSKRRI